jgi:hypothetical protein
VEYAKHNLIVAKAMAVLQTGKNRRTKEEFKKILEAHKEVTFF